MTRTLTALALLAALAGCVEKKETPEAAASSDQTVYVDVRTADEFAGGHVPGAINIPHDQMPQRWSELEAYRDQRMVVYCRTGRRSAIALQTLTAQGFTKAENGGGLDDMVAAGHSVTTE